MEIYTLLRAFADSWFLLAMTLFFLGTIAWAFRPGSRKTHDDISRIPLRADLETAAPETDGRENGK